MDTVELTSALVAIDSVNPALVPGGAGEAEIAAFVAAWARDAGLAVEMLDGPRPSVLVRARGRGGGRTLLLCGHLDTVGVAGMTGPWAPRVDGDRLYGRGAYDMKAGLAACLVACREAAALGLRGDVVVAAVADEEHASLGVQAALAHLAGEGAGGEAVRGGEATSGGGAVPSGDAKPGGRVADAAIVTEPTAMQAVIAHKGFVWTVIETRGRAAHGSRPDLGHDAIVAMGPVLTRLGALDAALAVRPEHSLLGRGSVHASLIEGGDELSTYPARCVLSLERRTLPGEPWDDVAALVDGFDATARTLLVREPFAVDPEAEIVRLVREASGAELAGAPFWTDAAFIAAAGVPTVLIGPDGDGAHAVEEWVSIADAERLTDVLVDVARGFCA